MDDVVIVGGGIIGASTAYPSTTLKSYKYWPPVSRVDNVYGDKNLFCSCPSMDEYKETAA